MNIHYTWRDALKSEAIEELLQKKLEKLDKHEDHVTQVHVTFESQGKQEHSVKVSAHLPGIEVNAHATDTDMYKAVDAVVHKLLRQVEAYKTKKMDHRDHTHCCHHDHE